MVRRTYLATYPREVPHRGVLNFLRALSGLEPAKFMQPAHTICFETYADHTGIKHLISIPGDVKDNVEGQLQTHVAGAALTLLSAEADVVAATEWEHAAEYGTSSAHVPLRIEDGKGAEAIIATILSNLSPLRPGQAVVMQWVVVPAPPAGTDEPSPAWPSLPHFFGTPDYSRYKEKNRERMFRVVLRTAATGPDARGLIRRVYNGLAVTHTDGMRFRPLWSRQVSLISRVRDRRSLLVPLAHLNALELSALLGIPAGNPNVFGLPKGRTRHLPADEAFPRTDLIVATSHYHGGTRPVGLLPGELVKHTHLEGKTGVGKSAFMVNLLVGQIARGYGVALIDPTGDTTAELLERIPPGREGDVVVFDPTDTEYPVGFNVFADVENPEVLADQMMAIFHGIYKDNGIYTSNYLRAAIQTLCTVPGMTMVEIPLFLTSQPFRSKVVAQVSDPMLTNLWERFDAMRRPEQMQLVMPAIHRVQPLLLRKSVRLSLGQVENRLDMARIMRERKILVVSLPKGPLGEETAGLFGSLVFARMVQAAMARPRNDRHPFFLHIDEVQNFLHTPVAIDTVLDEARKYGFGLTLAHQRESQLSPMLRSALAANTRTKVMFQISADDARSAARELGPPVTAEDLSSLGRFEAIIQTVVDGATTNPATVRTLAPVPPTSKPEAIRQASRRQWSTSARAVEAELLARQHTDGQAPEASEGWE